MAGVLAVEVDHQSEAADDATDGRGRRWTRWVAVGIALTVAAAAWATRGLDPWDVESRVADVVRTNPDATDSELGRAIAEAFADNGTLYSDGAGVPHNPVTTSGVDSIAFVRRFENDTVRVTVEYAEADVIPTGAGVKYCVVIDVPTVGASHRTTVQADFSRPDHCSRAHVEVAQP